MTAGKCKKLLLIAIGASQRCAGHGATACCFSDNVYIYLSTLPVMKKTLLVALTFCMLLAGCRQAQQAKSDPQVLATLNQLVRTQDYFRLRTALNAHNGSLSDGHSLYYRAVVSNAFNNPKRSNQQLAELLAVYDGALDDTLMKEVYNIKLQNHIHLYREQMLKQSL